MRECWHCSQTPEQHLESQIQVAASYVMMMKAKDLLPPDYAETLNSILQDWRTHALPECDPLAIS